MERLAPFNTPDSELQRFAPKYPPLDEQVVVPCYLDIRENREVNPPKPRLTLDIDEVKGDLAVVVMPYAGMAQDDKLILTLEAFLFEGEPFEPKEWTEIVGKEDVNAPVAFTIPRTVFEQPTRLVGCYIGLFVRLVRGGEEILSSLNQTIFIESGAAESHFLRAPHFKDVTNHTLFTDELPDGIDLVTLEHGDAQAGDAVVVFDRNDGVAAWGALEQAQPGSPLLVRVPASWLEANTGGQAVKVQYAGANRSFRTHSLLFQVEATRKLEAPRVQSERSFRLLRTGYEVSVPISDATSTGTIVVHLGTVKDSGAEKVRTSYAQSEAYVVRDNFFVFYFSPEQLGILLGRENIKAFYSLGVKEPIYSPETESYIKAPDDKELKHFPRLQCPAAAGSAGLSIARLNGNSVEIHVGSWLLIGVDQIVDIKAHIDTAVHPLLNRKITAQDLENKRIDATLNNSVVVAAGPGKKIRFTCEVNFNNGSGESFVLMPIDIDITQ
ncbi:hypothetical protein [Pseudomonas mosselii]|uniref:hypothetical protein n=1 Tax=Pseudomonas mosselii TaxID=78327 RepID=UPI001F4C364B|nr:hypothetical protein [Pseudomonas mosselii]MCH7420937.1 hypothetical protein [Pseudomonas mosselii]